MAPTDPSLAFQLPACRPSEERPESRAQCVERLALLRDSTVTDVGSAHPAFDHVVQTFIDDVAADPDLRHSSRRGAAKVVSRPAPTAQEQRCGCLASMGQAALRRLLSIAQLLAE